MDAWLSRLIIVLPLCGPLVSIAQAQAPESASQAPAQAQTAAPAPADPPTAAPTQPLLKAEELEQLVAPIALYPDPLLSQVFIASTYPLEVVQAERWATENKKLKGDQLKAAADKQAWDDSLKALVATPAVLTMMSTKLDWTQKLGDAVLAQQSDVMEAVQRLRGRAHDNKKLTTTKEQKVTVTQDQGKQVIAIVPATPNTIHVPYYDPAVAYGGWPYPAYPPYYFGYPGYIGAGIIATGLAFGAGWAIGRWTAGGGSWGGSVNWTNNNINIGSGNRVSHWQHNSAHRHGVRYNNADVRQRYAKTDAQAGKAREGFRGKEGAGGAGDRAGDRGRQGAGDRAGGADRRQGGGDRAGAGDRGGQRTGDRGGASGNRPQARPSGGGNTARSQSAGTRQASGPSAGGRDTAFSNVGSGSAARAQADRGRQSMGGGGPGGFSGAGGGFSGGGGGFRGGGGGGGGRGGGGRRSDRALKRHVTLLGYLADGLGFYRFRYVDGETAYVGVMAQEVQAIMPEAVMRDRDGYLRVSYEKIGLKFQTYTQWLASGGRLPVAALR